MEVFLVAAFIWICMVLLGAYVSSQKNRGVGEGFVLTVFLGPLGILIAALLPSKEEKSSRPVGYRSSPEYEAFKQDAIRKYERKKMGR